MSPARARAHTRPVAEIATPHSLPSTATPRRPAKPGLRREIGFIGLLWASGGSIIGSGWLFGAQGALASAGPAAIISWGIGAVAILLLALVHAELGAMYPVAGGTGRFPHYAFGGAVGASFGWFSWLQAATVAPIEVMAVIQYGQHYSFASGWMKQSGGQNVLTDQRGRCGRRADGDLHRAQLPQHPPALAHQ